MNSTRYSQVLRLICSHHTLQPPNFSGGRGETFSQADILLITTRTSGPLRIPWGTYMEWFYPPHQISMGISGSLCKKERWEALPMCWFPCTQQSHGEGSLSTSPHHRPAQHSWTCQDIYENRFETCIPPCMHCGGRWTHYGSFEWRVMPFGLSNAPAVFQWFINDILGDLLDVCVIGYLDNILIYSNSLDEHKDHVWDMLQWLSYAGLYTNPKKCMFHTDTVEYLSFILSLGGLCMDLVKVLMIQSWLV